MPRGIFSSPGLTCRQGCRSFVAEELGGDQVDLSEGDDSWQGGKDSW